MESGRGFVVLRNVVVVWFVVRSEGFVWFLSLEV